MQVFKLLFFITAVILLDNNILFIRTHLISAAYAVVGETASIVAQEESTKKNLLAYDDKASSPECGTSVATAIAVTTTFVVTTIAAIAAYAIATAPGFNWVFSIALTLTSLATLTIVQNIVLFACLYSFVRHPVIRDLNGNYISCSNPKIINSDLEKSPDKIIEICPNHDYVKVNDYSWPKNKAPYSDFIEFCHREAMGGANTTLDPREYETNTHLINNKEKIGGPLVCKTLTADKTVRFHSIRFGASYVGDKICVKAIGIGGTNWWPQPIIGCHLREPGTPPPLCKKSIPIKDANNKITAYDDSKCMGCYISSSCLGSKGSFSHAPLPMTAIVVQCLKESLGNILNGCIEDNTSTQTISSSEASLQGNKIGFLNTAKMKLKNTVKAVLALAIILFGIKALLGAISSYTEVMLFMVKVALVMYFAIGDGMNYYYNELANLSLGLADKILLSSNLNNICDYKGSEYIYPSFSPGIILNENESAIYREISLGNVQYNTKDSIKNAKSILDKNGKLSDTEFDAFLNKFTLKSYSYLAIWDRLDCRAVFYLGQSINQGVGYSILSVLLIIPGALFIGQIIITICVLLFVMVLLMMIIWSVHIFILSLIAMTIIVLFAPLFVPMCLFQFTRGFFDGWLKELITFALYPVIIFTFLGIVFATFDKLYFDDLKFKRIVDTKTDKIRTIFTYMLDPIDQCDSKDSNLSCIVANVNFVTKPLIFGINVTAADMGKGSAEIWSKFAILAIMGFFFWHFIKIMGSLAAELSGNFRANIGGGVTNPTDMATNVLATAVAAGKGFASKSDKDDKDSRKKQREGVSGGSNSSKEESSTSNQKGSINEAKSRAMPNNVSDKDFDTSSTSKEESKSSASTSNTNSDKGNNNISRAVYTPSTTTTMDETTTTSRGENISIAGSANSNIAESSSQSIKDISTTTSATKDIERSTTKGTNLPDTEYLTSSDKSENTNVKSRSEPRSSINDIPPEKQTKKDE